PDEAERVLGLWRDAGATVSITDTAEDVRRAAASDMTHCLVALLDERIVGTVIGGFEGWRGNVYRLGVLPGYPRRGGAAALVAAPGDWFAQKGIRRVTALVEREHPDAVGFWTAMGYTLDTRIARFVATVSR